MLLLAPYGRSAAIIIIIIIIIFIILTESNVFVW